MVPLMYGGGPQFLGEPAMTPETGYCDWLISIFLLRRAGVNCLRETILPFPPPLFCSEILAYCWYTHTLHATCLFHTSYDINFHYTSSTWHVLTWCVSPKCAFHVTYPLHDMSFHNIFFRNKSFHWHAFFVWHMICLFKLTSLTYFFMCIVCLSCAWYVFSCAWCVFSCAWYVFSCDIWYVFSSQLL